MRDEQQFAIRVVEEAVAHGRVRGVEVDADAGLHRRVIAAEGDEAVDEIGGSSGMGSGSQRIWLGVVAIVEGRAAEHALECVHRACA